MDIKVKEVTRVATRATKRDTGKVAIRKWNIGRLSKTIEQFIGGQVGSTCQ